MITAEPYASVAGVTARLDDGGTVSFVDHFSVTWGRAGLLEAPTPATATARLLDRSPGAVLARRTDLLGVDLQLGYYAVRGDTYAPTLTFRGRITDVVVERRAEGGYYVTLAASSREVEAANYRAPAGASWPAESFTSRLSRIVGLLPSTLFRRTLVSPPSAPVFLPTRADFGLTDVADPTLDFGDYTTGPATPAGVDALTLLRELFTSVSPLPMVYDPGVNGIVTAGRRRFQYSSTAAAVRTSSLTASTARGGLYVQSAYGGLDLDSYDVDTPGQLEQPLDSRVTQVEVSYLNGAAANAAATVSAATPDAASESTTGRRTLSVSSIHGSTTYAQQLANMYRDVAAAEARAPRLGALSYRTALNGGFTSTAQRDALLNGAETTAAYFLARTFLPDLGVRPLVGIVGGSISYGAGDWSLLLNPVAVTVDSLWAPLPIRLAPRLRLRDIHPSVTFGDAGYLDSAPGQ